MKTILKKNILIILLLFLAVSAIIIPKQLNNLDEIWNFNFARNIANDLLPYKDFNMIQTPLLPIICGIILKFTYNELIIMRIIAIVLITTIFFIAYKILEILKVNKFIINIFILSIFFLLYKHLCIDYNFGVLLIILITTYSELKRISNGEEILHLNKKDFILGILVGTSILLKQTTGICLSLIFIFYKLLHTSTKQDFKNVLKIICIRLLGVLIPIICFLIYLNVNNIWEDFLDYTVYSLKTFTNKISYIYLITGNYGIIISILSIVVPLTIIIMYFISVCKTPKTSEQKNIFILFCFSVASFIVVYPIADSIHFLIGSFPCMISITYILWLVVKERIINENNKKIIYGIKNFIMSFSSLCILLISILSTIIITRYLIICKNYKELNHFTYIPASSEKILKINSFIEQQNKEGKDVYILDATAAIYMIPMDKYNKDFDMFLKGNLGSKGEDGQIKKLDKLKNAIILIMNEEEKRNWQNPEKVRTYIINNWEKIGEIENFDIYNKY